MSIINSAVLTHLNPSEFISFIHTEIFVIFEVLDFQCNYGLAHPQTGSQSNAGHVYIFFPVMILRNIS